jgi:phosphotransferase system HPr (HPr) family protein
MRNLDQNQMPAFNPVFEAGYCVQSVKVLNRHGLHARPSAMLYEKTIKAHGDGLELYFQLPSRNGDDVRIESVFDLMALGLDCETEVKLRLAFSQNGALDEEKSLTLTRSLYDLFLGRFDEKE